MWQHRMHGKEMIYQGRRKQLQDVEPNPAHQALVTLEDYLGDNLLIVTQNVDDLQKI